MWITSFKDEVEKIALGPALLDDAANQARRLTRGMEYKKDKIDSFLRANSSKQTSYQNEKLKSLSIEYGDKARKHGKQITRFTESAKFKRLMNDLAK